MATFDLKIITPEREAFSGPAEKIIVRTSEGDVGILAKHINYVSALNVGKLTIINADNKTFAAISGGFISVNNGDVTVMTDFLEWQDEIDVNRAEKAAEYAKVELAKKKDKTTQIDMEVKLKKALNRISVSRN